MEMKEFYSVGNSTFIRPNQVNELKRNGWALVHTCAEIPCKDIFALHAPDGMQSCLNEGYEIKNTTA